MMLDEVPLEQGGPLIQFDWYPLKKRQDDMKTVHREQLCDFRGRDLSDALEAKEYLVLPEAEEGKKRLLQEASLLWEHGLVNTSISDAELPELRERLSEPQNLVYFVTATLGS